VGRRATISRQSDRSQFRFSTVASGAARAVRAHGNHAHGRVPAGRRRVRSTANRPRSVKNATLRAGLPSTRGDGHKGLALERSRSADAGGRKQAEMRAWQGEDRILELLKSDLRRGRTRGGRTVEASDMKTADGTRPAQIAGRRWRRCQAGGERNEGDRPRHRSVAALVEKVDGTTGAGEVLSIHESPPGRRSNQRIPRGGLDDLVARPGEVNGGAALSVCRGRGKKGPQAALGPDGLGTSVIRGPEGLTHWPAGDRGSQRGHVGTSTRERVCNGHGTDCNP